MFVRDVDKVAGRDQVGLSSGKHWAILFGPELCEAQKPCADRLRNRSFEVSR